MGGMGGMMGDDGQTSALSMSGAELCGSCTVLSGQIKITFADGSHANDSMGVYVHHILTNVMTSMPNFVRTTGLMGMGFVGAGDDNGNSGFLYAPRDGSVESGFWIAPTDRFAANVVLVNYNNVPKRVYVNYDLEYLPGHVGKRVKSSLISATGSPIAAPKTSKLGAVNTTSFGIPFTESGHIILAKGHLHDGGTNMFLKISGKTNFQCVSKASYGLHKGNKGAETSGIVDMSDCNKEPVKITAGDTMVMTAEYDLRAHPPRVTTGGGEASSMGMFRVIFAPDKNW